MSTVRPEMVTDSMLEYLDGLRERGETTMFAAGPYLRERFDLTRADSHVVLGYWMLTFTERRGLR